MTEIANITVTLRHETGREDKIPNCRRAEQTTESEIEVEYLVENKFVTDTYDPLSWDIVGVSHTEMEI